MNNKSVQYIAVEYMLMSSQLSTQCHNQSAPQKHQLAHVIAQRCQAQLTAARRKYDNDQKVAEYIDRA